MSSLAFINLGGPEMAMIFVLALLLFGAKKLPSLARGIGQSMGEFKKARDEFERELHMAEHDVEKKEAKKMIKPPKERRLEVSTAPDSSAAETTETEKTVSVDSNAESAAATS